MVVLFRLDERLRLLLTCLLLLSHVLVIQKRRVHQIRRRCLLLGLLLSLHYSTFVIKLVETNGLLMLRFLFNHIGLFCNNLLFLIDLLINDQFILS